MKSDHLWGIDLGGTKIEGVVLESKEAPAVLFRDRVLTEGSMGALHVVQQIKLLVEQMENSLGYRPERIGVGTPGSLDSLGILKNSNTLCLNGRPFKQDLESTLGMEVQIANDANCFALAETSMGCVKEQYPEARVVFGVIMGTGVGGGIVVDGKVINGTHGIAGEWGHNFLDISGGLCYCGKTGCVEAILSGPALESYYTSLSGMKKDLREIYKAFKSGKDTDARKTMERLTIFFGIGLSVIVNILDPDVIVIGGGVGNIDLIYTEGIRSLKNYVFNDHFETPVLKPKLGDSAGVFGAAFLVA